MLVLLAVQWASAQIGEPVTVTTQFRDTSATEAEIVFTAKIEKGWHVYATNLPEGGPTSATFTAEHLQGAVLNGALRAEGNEHEIFDKMFEMRVRYFEGQVVFVQPLKLTG